MNHVAVDKVLRAHNMAPNHAANHSELFCETCAMIKRKTADISRTLQERPTIPFSFVGLDFWETRDESLQGNRYVFGAICYATSVVYPVFLPSRKPGSDCLKQLSGLAQSYGFKLNRIRLDNDTVFHSSQFHEPVTTLSLRLEFSAPHSQFQNGMIERTWGTLSRRTLCMLSHAELSVGYWEFAMASAVHVFNRTPRRSGSTAAPLEAIIGKRPSLDHLRVFGCPAYVDVPSQRRTKMSPTTRQGVYVGYTPSSQSW